MNKIEVKEEDLSGLHRNFSSLSAHIDNLKNFLSELRIKFHTICISESRLKKVLCINKVFKNNRQQSVS